MIATVMRYVRLPLRGALLVLSIGIVAIALSSLYGHWSSLNRPFGQPKTYQSENGEVRLTFPGPPRISQVNVDGKTIDVATADCNGSKYILVGGLGVSTADDKKLKEIADELHPQHLDDVHCNVGRKDIVTDISGTGWHGRDVVMIPAGCRHPVGHYALVVSDDKSLIYVLLALNSTDSDANRFIQSLTIESKRNPAGRSCPQFDPAVSREPFIRIGELLGGEVHSASPELRWRATAFSLVLMGPLFLVLAIFAAGFLVNQVVQWVKAKRPSAH